MRLCVIVPVFALVTLTKQAPSPDEMCVCQLTHSERVFPHGKLSTVEDSASKCNTNIIPQKTSEVESLLLGLERRLPQLQEDVSILEREDDGDLYGVLSLQMVENELIEIKELMSRLNSTTLGNLRLMNDTATQLEDLRAEMHELETYDTMQVVKRRKDNKRLKSDLDQCRNSPPPNSTTPTTKPPHGYCPHGQFRNITGPRVFTRGEFHQSYKYGAWGRDPRPVAGTESWYWLVVLTSSDRDSNYILRYRSLSALIVGESVQGEEGSGIPDALEDLEMDSTEEPSGKVYIHSSNPATNTIQGPNVVLYGGALYYNCYNQGSVCRFSITTKVVTTVQLPEGTRFNSKGNFCHLDECYPYTDLDLATDESGVWVIYTTNQDFGNLVLSKVEEGEPVRLGKTWKTSVFKQGVTNTFMVCGVLYATRYADKDVEEIFYSFDTRTGAERFDVGVFINKMTPNIYFLNYSPVDQMLHAFFDSYMVSYEVLLS